MKKGSTSPYKGIPRSQWAELKGKIKSADVTPKNEPVASIPAFAEQVYTEPAVPTPIAAPQPEAKQKIDVAPKAPPPALHVPPNLFQGNVLKLQLIGKNGTPTDPIPGYVTRWFNDDGNRIALAQASGWEFVDRNEVVLNENLTPLNTDLGSKVREVVGKQQDGTPMYAYAMKKRNEIHAAHMQEREVKVNQRIEDSLRKGLTDYSRNPENRQYVGGQPGTNLPPIDISAPRTFR